MAIRKRYLGGRSPAENKSGIFLNINPLRSSGSSPRKKKRKILKILALGAIALFIFAIVGGIGVFAYFAKDLPDPSSLGNRQVTESTKIYDRTGGILLYEIHGEEKRTVVNLAEISSNLKNATIVAEDKDFYSHEGVDLRGIARALWRDIVARDLQQGGSTITQQLIKNSILTKERTFSRKIKEWILAIELEQKFSKDQILEMYLNQIPYGSNAYGTEAASQTFFGKSAKDLTLGEAAVLASLPKAPTYYSPYGTHTDKLRERADYIIDRMKELGYASDEQAKAAKDENALAKKKPFIEKMLAPHFTMTVKEYLADKYGDKTLEKGGLRVITSLDAGKQSLAEDLIKTNIEKNSKKYNVANAALAAIDPNNGQILALVGSKDYWAPESLPKGCVPGKNCKFEPNTNVAVSSLSPGSSFKPFVYATLFKKGYTPDTILFDLETEFNASCTADHVPDSPYVKPSDCYHPNNYDGKFRGPISARNALAQSLNIPAVKAFYLAGMDKSIETANNFGINTLNKKSDSNLALVLGGGGVKLLEQTGAYGVFAAEGVKHDIKLVLKVSAASGEVLEDNTADSGREVLDKNIAREITDILSDNVARAPMFGTNSPMYFSDRVVAAKTGTSNEYRNAWTFGYTPSLAVGVWAGNNDYSPMNQAGGISAAAPIWHDFMAKALEGAPAEQFNKPETKQTGKPMLDGNFNSGMTVQIDRACGDKLAKGDAALERVDPRTYVSVHSILYYATVDDPLGTPPSNPADDPQFLNWETPVLNWAGQNGYINQSPPTEYCEVENYAKPKVSIVSPKNGDMISPAVEGGKTGFTLMIEAEIFVSAGVNQANFFFDGNLIGTRSSAPWLVNYAVGKNTSDGAHKISVRVFDKSGGETKDEITVNLNLDFEPPKISLREPLCAKPVCFLSATATDEKSGVAGVEFYYQKTGGGAPMKISGAASQDNDFYQIMWQTGALDLGSYDVWAKAKDDRGNEATSAVKKVNVNI
jgi:1A family penicillin-binding protein